MTTEQKYLPGIVKGYKATDKDMKCRGLQYILGEWQECAPGSIIKCSENGLHFCEHPSGPWSYYSDPGTRIFEVEAEDVLDDPATPGADRKLVARKLRLIREIFPDGDGNTGNRNTGDGNTGNRNTGNGNTGDWNTGNWNTGNGNTGDGNTGYGNTGDRNTGDGNTGDRNTGNRNTGNRNTGDGNTGDYHSGFFCLVPATVICFDVDTRLTRDAFQGLHGVAAQTLLSVLAEPTPRIPESLPQAVTRLPGYTFEKYLALHSAHIAGRSK